MADIAINPVTRRVQFTGNTGTGPYAFTFNILQASDIVVYKNNVLLTLTTDYTVSIAVNGTGTITMVVALVTTDVLTIIGGRELSRTTDFVTAGDLLASSLNEQLDSNVIMSQQLDERFGRTIKAQPGDEDATLDLPLVADRANTFLAFDGTGNAITSNTTEFLPTAIFSSTAIGDGSKTVFALVVNVSSNPSSVQIYIDGVHQETNAYSTSGSNVTFTEAPPVNSSIEFTVFSVSDLGSTTAAQVSIADAGGYYSSTAVEGALQEIGAKGIITGIPISSGVSGLGAGVAADLAVNRIVTQGTGITGTGTIYKSSAMHQGDLIVTRIFIDLTGLNCGGTAGDIIGSNGTSNPCHIGQIIAAQNGTIFFGQMRCVETPAGGDTDIDLYVATEGTGVEDQAITALTETQIINGGTQSAGDVDLIAAIPAANKYFYLVGQGGGNATYTAGQFLIELHGYA